MRRPRPTIRLRLTLLYAGLLVACTALLLGMSWWLLAGHLDRTLPASYADAVMSRLGWQYFLAVIGAALVALGLGWAIAGHALAPVRRIASTARRVTERRLDDRIPLDGPDDELHELAATLNAMLDRLQEAMESQKRFVANASHELRTPLTVIHTEAEVTLSDPQAGVEDLRSMGRVVLETTEAMEVLLEGLLLLARGDGGSVGNETVDLAEVARRVTQATQREASAADVRLKLTADAATIRGESVLAERMVSNLVENAVRHNVAGGFAEVEVATHGGQAVVRVTNGGPVISAEAVSRIAEPFQRLDRCLSTPGSGLGLSIVRAVAEAHGGRLTLAARPAGGLVATVELPSAPARMGMGAASAPALIGS